MSEFSQLTRKIASLAIPGITEPKPDNHLRIKSLSEERPVEDQHARLQRLRAEARRKENELDYGQIESLGFNLFTTEEVDALAIVDINRPEKEGPHTVRDLHLGPQNENQICETCSGNFRSCHGHYGRILLPKLIHPLAIPQVILVLSCVCNSCGSLLTEEENIVNEGINRLTGIRRLQAIKEMTTRLKSRCSRNQNRPGITPCSGIPIYGSVKAMTKEKDYKLLYKFGRKAEDEEYFRTPEQIFRILDSISDRDADLLGFVYGSHPRSMIIERLLVIPYCARPDLTQDDTLYPDDTSSMYSDITKHSNEYFNPNTTIEKRESIIRDLYFRVRHFMRNEGSLYRQGSNHVYTDITTRLQGKTALIRAHIMGKRVNFAGRTVAAPGSYLRVDEIGIPQSMAEKLTRPITVSELNRGEIQARYEARKVLWLTPRTGRFAGNRIMVTDQYVQQNPNYQTQLGDIAERILEDNDIVIFNRQPSLHRQNLIALKVKIVPGRVIMINLSLTSPMNADFDGDELNIHLPQTIEAYSEAEQLLSVQASLMNEETNQPMIGIVYNALTGAYLLTRDENTSENRQAYQIALDKFQRERTPEAEKELRFYERKIGMMDELVFSQVLISVAERPQFGTLRERVERKGQIWGTGKALLSGSFPEDFYYNAKGVLIEDGILLEGTISKETIGRVDGSVIAEMYKQLDATAAVDFMSDLQFITREYLHHRGFTVGLDDCISDDPSFQEDLDKIIADAEVKVMALTGESSNKIQAEARERQITKALDIVKTVGDQIAVRKLRSDNNLLIMVGAGSKGTKLNLAQMSSLLGQAKINNKRLPQNLPGERSLPIFRPGDQDPRARGFCRSSFYSGLMPDELFFHAMGGRESITDTAVNTSNTGQLSHNLIKAGEDAHISGDGSVRTADGSIIELVYGGDGLSAGELGTVKIRDQAVPFFRNLKQLADKISAKYS